tara:strand:- start:498 stop:857 length:360 start_codon:yes stop_codon:yes gene_type:complete
MEWGGYRMSFMTTDDFEADVQHGVPPYLVRQRNTSILERSLNELHEQIATLQNENLYLTIELVNCNNLIRHLESDGSSEIKQIEHYEKRLNNIQEILFTNSEKIPSGLYVQLMNALVNK